MARFNMRQAARRAPDSVLRMCAEKFPGKGGNYSRAELRRRAKSHYLRLRLGRTSDLRGSRGTDSECDLSRSGMKKRTIREELFRAVYDAAMLDARRRERIIDAILRKFVVKRRARGRG